MTGEITLRGKVLPVGGIKEKVLAARRSGIRTILLPAENEKDLLDVPKEARDDLTFRFARTVEEILDLALTPATGTSVSSGSRQGRRKGAPPVSGSRGRRSKAQAALPSGH
jgi:ATP-dependent Lon protease